MHHLFLHSSPSVISVSQHIANLLYFTPPFVLLKIIQQSLPSVIYACQNTLAKLDMLFSNKVVNQVYLVLSVQYQHQFALSTKSHSFKLQFIPQGSKLRSSSYVEEERKHIVRSVRRKRNEKGEWWSQYLYILAEIFRLRLLAPDSEAKGQKYNALWKMAAALGAYGGDVNLSTKYIPASRQANISRDKLMQLSRSVARKMWNACKTNAAQNKITFVADTWGL